MSQNKASHVQPKRVIFCTYSSLYSSIVLEKLIAEKDIDIVAIINSTRIIHPEYGAVSGAIKQIQTSGWRYASYLFMVTDLFRWFQPLSKILSKVIPTKYQKSVHALAKQQTIPILNTIDINLSESVNFIKESNPDYLLAAHFNQLIKPTVLDLSGIEFLNIHPSVLPAYKGVDPVFYALLTRQKESGVSLHKMSEVFDSGEILSQKIISMRAKQSVFFYNCQLFSEGAILAIAWMKNKTTSISESTSFVKDKVNVSNNDENYDSWPDRSQIKQFKQADNYLVKLLELWKRY